MNLYQFKNRFSSLFKQDIQKNNKQFNTIGSLLKHSFPLNSNLFYYSKPVINIVDKEKGISCDVKKHNLKNVYLSYYTLDNKFQFSPEKSLINIREIKSYNFFIDICSSESLNVKPIIIHYQNNQKLKQTEIKEYGQNVIFSDGVDKCRITFKLIGSGTANIDLISIVPGDEMK